ncbi:MAG: sacsin N-terminal ATP-binding-like domain-containing protein, partial [Promethearchaeota archaeon]
MEIEKEFNNSNLIRKRIIYPAYQTTRRFHNLYSDVRTWVRELIQNADDADAENIHFNVNIPNLVEVINNGHPFDSNDVERLLTPCLGGKEFDKTGAMNLGALSVLAISDSFFYHSGNILLKFEMDHEKEDFVPYIDENSPSHFEGTKLILPFHSRLSRDDLKKLDKIDEYLTQYSHLLFTNKLKSIVLNYPTKKLELIKEVENESKFKFGRVQASVRNITIVEKFTKGKKEHLINNKWVLFKRNIVIPKKILSKKDLEQSPEKVELPLYFAFAIEDCLPKRVEFPIYIIFPSDTSLGLGFVLCSNFKPETSRKGFSTEGIDGKLNIFLLRKASELIELVLTYFKKKVSSFLVPNKIKFFNALLKTLYYRETYSSLESYVKDHIYNKVIKFLEKNILDKDGNWIQASKIAIADSGLWPFLNNQYHFIEKPLNDKITKLLKVAGVKEVKIKDLVDQLSFGKIRRLNDLLNIWTYLLINRNKLNKKMKEQLVNNKTLPNRIGILTNPKLLAIPDEDAIGLYDSRKELNAEFVKNGNLNSFIRGLGIKRIKRNQVLEYFISIKSRLSLKNIHLIKKYYKFFYKFGLLDKKREIVLTNQGFKNPNEAFFNRVSIANVLGNKIPLIPQKLESSRICRMYLENLGVSKEIKAKFVVKHIKKYGNKVISLDLLRFLSKNSQELNSRDLKGLEKMEIIPTTNGKFVRPSDCYLLTEQNEKILANLVNYFDPEDETNKEWLKFFKKIGIPKHPRIKHLQLALNEALAMYQTLEKSNDDNKNKVLERIELILNSILKNGQKEEKELLLLELEKLNFIPTTKGINRPCDVYLREPKIVSFLGESVPYSLIKIPNELVMRLGIHKKPIPEDVANYLLYWLIKQKFCNILKLSNDDPVKLFDGIYSFLGRAENFNKLRIGIIKKLLNKSIIYVPRYKCFEKASRLVMYSREAEMIYGNEKNLIRYSDYPNSLNFFKRVGVKTSINSDDIADFLVEYINQGEIETQRLFMLYNILGQRFRFLSNKQQLMVKKSKIILCEDLKSFEYPENVFIPDEKLYVEKFPSIKVAIVNDKVVDFLEYVGVRKVSNVIIKNVVFSGNVLENDYSKLISKNIKELIPFLETIAKDSSITLDKDWKRRLNKVKCVICDQIFYELQYKTKKNRIQGRSVEY